MKPHNLKSLSSKKIYDAEIRKGFLGQFNFISFLFPVIASQVLKTKANRESETSGIIVIANSSVRNPRPESQPCKVLIISFEVLQILVISPTITKTI